MRAGVMRTAGILPVAAILILFWTAWGMADYSIPAWTVSQGGGQASDGSHTLTFVVGQPSPVITASSGIFSLTTGLTSLFLDVSGPVILHSPPVSAVPDRTALDLTAAIADDMAGVESATVYYCQGGATAFRERTMTRSGALFSASIPPSAVTERGILYYIEAADSSGNHSWYPSGAPDSLIDVRVWFEGLKSAFELPAGKYRMVSLPGSTNADPSAVLSDDLGSYAKAVWRLGRWTSSPECSTGCYREYPDVPDMDRGKAFWLISRDATDFDFSGLSTLPDRPFKVHLQMGWNQIGTPFAFSTDWLSTEILYGGDTYDLNEQHVVGPDTIFVEDNLVSYDGTYHGRESTMEPWHGYWIYNGSTREVDLLMNPRLSASRFRTPIAAQAGGEVRLDLTVSSPGFPDRDGVAAMSQEAKDGWDPMDHREPPPFGDYVRLVFEKPDWGRHRGTYMTDVRSSAEDGARWEFRVDASKDVEATLTLPDPEGLPDEWKVFVYDRARGLRMDKADLPYTFRTGRGRVFSLIAGTDEFVDLEETRSGIPLKAQIVQIAPNPFERSVGIAYFSPPHARVSLDVFSIEGRLVKTMDIPAGDEGMGRVSWNGDSRRGAEAAPGVYFLRLRSGRETDTVKVLKIR
jgi:hypothetical protein